MKVLSLDVETTAIRPEEGQILQIGMVYGDTNDPQPLERLVYREITIKEEQLYGTFETVQFNAELIKNIDVRYTHETLEQARRSYNFFFRGRSKCTVLGKNVGGFDIPWLRHHQFDVSKFRPGVIDVGQAWMNDEDTKIPNTEECFKRAGLEDPPKHTALEDAYAALQLFWRSR